MNDLQLGLLALGGTAVVGVVAYNQWQAMKARKLAESLLPKDRTDVLMGDGAVAQPEDAPAVIRTGGTRQEPVFSAEAESAGEVASPPGNVMEAPDAAPAGAGGSEATSPAVTLEASPVAPDSFPRPSAAVNEPPEALLSPQIDDIAAFESLEPIDVAELLHSQREALRGLDKPLTFAGFNEETETWESCQGGLTACRRLRVGVQLADRRGAISESQLQRFRQAMDALADTLTAVANLVPQREAMVRAQQIDAFCASVDIQVGVNVVAGRQPFPGTKLRALAEAAGMELDGFGSYIKSDEDGNILFRLTAHDPAGFTAERMKTLAAGGVTFLLDVPRVAHGERLFNQMIDCARRFADTLGGTLVDDNRAPLNDTALGAIRAQIGQYQARMKAQGLPAGSPLARRLFA